MKKVKAIPLSIVLITLAGCASNLSQYRMIPQTHVETIKSDVTQQDEIVIIETPLIAYEEIIERSPNVSSVTRITDLRGIREPSVYSLSPAEPVVVFQAIERISNSWIVNIWKTSTAGGAGLTRLTAGRYFDLEPAFSKSGKHVYFSSNRSSSLPKIFKIRVDSAMGLMRVTHSQSEDRCPCADCKAGRIFYMCKPSSGYDWQIWYINNDGTLPTQLKEGAWPRVSPDGKKVVYCAKDRRTGNWQIWSMNCDGTEQTQLTTDSRSNNKYPSWSPNSKLIVYASDIGKDSNGRRNYDIWIMTDYGTHKTQLTTNGSTDLMPQVSPDSKYIYFLSNRGFNWDIWRMRVSK